MKTAIAEIKYWLKRLVFLLPPIQLLTAFIISFLNIDANAFVKLGNSLGFSITTGLIYVAHFCFTGRYCLFTRISSMCVLLIAVFNFFTSLFVGIDEYPIYENWYARIMSVVALVLWVIFVNSKKDSKNNT